MVFTTNLTLFVVLSSLVFHVALGEMICENLPNEVCAFSISSSGKRCLLETYSTERVRTKYQCRTSEVVVERMTNYIESDVCIRACGVDRKSVGISSDAFLEPKFASKLCSSRCYQNCPNIVDLYFNLAAGEGAFLPDLCAAQRKNPHRAMIELMSNGDVAAAGPTRGGMLAAKYLENSNAPSSF